MKQLLDFRKLKFTFFALLMCGPQLLCAQTNRPIYKAGLEPVPPAKARMVIQQFQEALRRSDWPKALSFCSNKVKKAAADYQSPEAFFQIIVPVESIVKAQSFHLYTCSGPGDADDYESMTMVGLDVEVQRAEGEPTAQWRWTMEKTDKGWVIDFNSQPLRAWLDREITRKKEQAERFQKNQAGLTEKTKGIKTRLTPVSKRYVVGRPMMFRLELINEGETELQYDDQQVGVNESLIIHDEMEKLVPYTYGPNQTGGHFRLIAAGQTVVLFDNFDIGKQYDLRKPGRYRVQFGGRGLEVGVQKDKPNSDAPPSSWFLNVTCTTNSFPSNVVEIELKSPSAP